ncbi:MAG: N-acetyltransferase [Hyphomicrobiaceae bacterium]|nr:N-acetyltransferase [Hyphomicrobiaceae bacterium]MCC0023308.1 N-acetyltransferase [Hyphomicrobiaceae bacterium]
MRVDDLDWVEAQQARAFGPGRFARAAFRVRERIAPDLALSRIAEYHGEMVGSVLLTRISIGGVNGVLLGPLAVEPSTQNLGAGRTLVRAASQAALGDTSCHFVLLVGDAPYYGPLGFVPTNPKAVVFPGPVDPARILALCDDEALALALKGPILPQALS